MAEIELSGQSLALGETAVSLKKFSKKKESALKNACSIFEKNLSNSNEENLAFNKNALRRQLFYAGLSLGIAVASKRAVRRTPAWKTLQGRYEAFASEIGASYILASITHESLRNFAMHAVTASNRSYFYASIAIFLINEFETRNSFADLVRAAAPVGEIDFLARVKRQLFNPLVGGVDPSMLSANLKSKNLHSVSMGFAVDDHHRARFETFYNAFKSDSDGFAHFIAFRHARSDPRFLVKSFIAIGFPTENRNYYRFFHFYRVPSVGAQKRLSRGFVLPLKKAVYFVGGQSPDRELASSYDAFDSLEVIALDWNDLSTPEALFGGLMMSTNYKDSKLLSPMALRATPIDNSFELGADLDRFDLQELEENLQADINVEKALAQRSFIETTLEQQCLKINSLTNTNRLQWQVPEIYQATNGETSTLTKAQINSMLEREFGTSAKPKFTAEDGAPFSFWDSLRFGPISKA